MWMPVLLTMRAMVQVPLGLKVLDDVLTVVPLTSTIIRLEVRAECVCVAGGEGEGGGGTRTFFCLCTAHPIMRR
jgi:hypothetical protein